MSVPATIRDARRTVRQDVTADPTGFAVLDAVSLELQGRADAAACGYAYVTVPQGQQPTVAWALRGRMVGADGWLPPYQTEPIQSGALTIPAGIMRQDLAPGRTYVEPETLQTTHCVLNVITLALVIAGEPNVTYNIETNGYIRAATT